MARKMARYMWRVKRRIWEMKRQIPSLLELVLRIKLVKIAKGKGLLSLLEMLREVYPTVTVYNPAQYCIPYD